MRRYSSYKNSGIEWLGEIPAHWEISKLKWVASVVLGKMLEEKMPTNVESAGYTLERYLKSKNVGWLELFVNENDVEQMWFSQNEKDMYLLRDGDIVMNEGGDIGKVALWVDTGFNCYIQNSVHKISVIDGLVIPEYLLYLIYAASKSGYYWSLVNQISIAHLTKEKLENTAVVLPSLDEQKAIAAFLSEKVAEVDAIIKGKEAQLNDISNYKKAIISEMLLKGVNDAIDVREAGVPYIGSIPSHWMCAPLKYFLKGNMTYGANESAESDNKSYPRYVRITDITDDGELREDTFKSLSPEKAKDYMLSPGDILFARSGATVGKTYLYRGGFDACYAGYLIRARCGEKLLPEFLFLYTQTSMYEAWKNSVYIQATIPNIGADKYSELRVLVPPIEEQREIVEAANKKCESINSLQKELKEQIEDLYKYREAIISEAVTGQIDCRE